MTNHSLTSPSLLVPHLLPFFLPPPRGQREKKRETEIGRPCEREREIRTDERRKEKETENRRKRLRKTDRTEDWEETQDMRKKKRRQKEEK